MVPNEEWHLQSSKYTVDASHKEWIKNRIHYHYHMHIGALTIYIALASSKLIQSTTKMNR